MAEIPADLYTEWMAFDLMEPLNPAGMILKGLGGESKPAPQWQAQKAKLLQHIAITKGGK